MIKELKHVIFILVISLFIFFTLNYYFSDNNKKNSYRSLNEIDEKITDYSKQLFLLVNDTNRVVQYVEKKKNIKKKNYNFWKLINDTK